MKKLMGLQPKTATVIRKGKEMEIPIEDVIVGNAGKYRSVDKAGNEAINATSSIIILSESCFELF